ncbi:MAG: TRAP transporter substrate-binding protein, partial [Candidatus Eremiobacteraeota bacterium]|nr:TRAP transporter substrate-binding protein [Candidatus Eremiobacteraeota bacterium]
MQNRRTFIAAASAATGASLGFPAIALGQSPRTLSLGHVNPPGTGYDILASTFGTRLKELSKGALAIQVYPGGQLGNEEPMTQKLRAGDLDFVISSTANFAAAIPQAGVFSLEYLYPSEAIVVKSVTDPGINDTFEKMVRASLPGAVAVGLFAQGLRSMFAKFTITSVADVKGKKVRVQATKTEDAFMVAYDAVPVHMPFGQVYTALQTGVVQ